MVDVDIVDKGIVDKDMVNMDMMEVYQGSSRRPVQTPWSCLYCVLETVGYFDPKVHIITNT